MFKSPFYRGLCPLSTGVDEVVFDWDGEGPCPGIPELVVEIMSPGQTFEDLSTKANDYLQAGVDRVWVVNTTALSITIFCRDELPQTIKSDAPIRDFRFPGLELPVSFVFTKIGRRG